MYMSNTSEMICVHNILHMCICCSIVVGNKKEWCIIHAFVRL